MAQHVTHKSTPEGKRRTLARRAIRSVKYAEGTLFAPARRPSEV